MTEISGTKLKDKKSWVAKLTNWFVGLKSLFSERVIEIEIKEKNISKETIPVLEKIEDRGVQSVNILDYLENYDKGVQKVTDEADLSVELMDRITHFRDETGSLDYIRKEIEGVMNTKGGEEKMMKGFANTLKNSQKKSES